MAFSGSLIHLGQIVAFSVREVVLLVLHNLNTNSMLIFSYESKRRRWRRRRRRRTATLPRSIEHFTNIRPK
jgi:hypothetical protein